MIDSLDWEVVSENEEVLRMNGEYPYAWKAKVPGGYLLRFARSYAHGPCDMTECVVFVPESPS